MTNTSASIINFDYDYSALERDRVIIDASAVLNSNGFKSLIERYYPTLDKTKRQLLIPKGIIAEMESNARRINDRKYTADVNTAIHNIEMTIQKGYFKYFGSAEDTCAEAICKYLMLNRKTCDITVIAQYADLRDDVMLFNSLKTLPGKRIVIKCLTSDGRLEDFENVRTAPAATTRTSNAGEYHLPEYARAFREHKSPKDENDIINSAMASYIAATSK